MSRGGGFAARSHAGWPAWLDELRAVFGQEHIDGQIRRGLKGECVFYANENGIELGQPGPPGVPLSRPRARPGSK
jgi:hypothetical protein